MPRRVSLRILGLALLVAVAPMLAAPGPRAGHDAADAPLPAGARVEGRLPVPVWEPQVARTGDGALVIDRGPWRDGGAHVVEVPHDGGAPRVAATLPDLMDLTGRSIAWAGDRALVVGRSVTEGEVRAYTYAPGATTLTPTGMTFQEDADRTWAVPWGDDVAVYLWEDAASDLAVYRVDVGKFEATRLHADVPVPEPATIVVDDGVAYVLGEGDDGDLEVHRVDVAAGIAVDVGVRLPRWYGNAGVTTMDGALHVLGGARVPVTVDPTVGAVTPCPDVGFVTHRPGLVPMGDRVLAVMGVPDAAPDHLPSPVGEVWSYDPTQLCATQAERGPVRFVVLGDTGFGDDTQRAVAEGIVDVCAAAGCDLVVGTGDNIYMEGVESVDDPQWASKFEAPYHDVDLPFHMTIGNHDDLGDEGAQVAYHYHADRPGFKWVMPDQWYAHRHGDALFVAIDTTEADSGEQRAFVQEALAASDAPWRFVHGHHPVLSNGKHGDATGDVAAFLLASVCGEADAYFAGHDHLLAWLDAPEACAGTHLFVSGAGGQGRPITHPDRNPTHFQLGETPGFLWVEVDGATLTARFHAADGGLLYEGVVVREDLLEREGGLGLDPAGAALPGGSGTASWAQRVLTWTRPALPVALPLLLGMVLLLGRAAARRR